MPKWFMAALLFIGVSARGLTIPTVPGTTFTLPEGSGYKLFIPNNFVASSAIDLVVHFHGDPATVQNNVGYDHFNAITVTINLGTVSSAYQTPFATDTNLFQSVMNDALSTARAQTNIPDNANLRKVVVSSFSAGYAAVREVLKSTTYFNRIDGLCLEDSLYASFTSTTNHAPLASQMTGFEKYALAAANKTKVMTFTQSEVPTYTYCTTGECADDLISYVGTTATTYTAPGLGTLEYYRRAAKGDFTVLGATGSDAAAHSEHLQYMAQALSTMPLAQVPEPTMLAPIFLSALLLRRPAATSRAVRRRHL